MSTNNKLPVDAGDVHQYYPPTVRVLEGQPLLHPERILGLDRFVPMPPQACGHLLERPIVLEVENEEVVLRRGGTRAAALVVCELQVIAPARQREHHSVVAGVALEGGNLLKPEGIAVEAHHPREAVRRPRDPDLADGRSLVRASFLHLSPCPRRVYSAATVILYSPSCPEEWSSR